MGKIGKALTVIFILCATIAIAQRGPLRKQRQAAPRENLENRVKIEVRGEFRYIESNGIPDHEYGRFPNRENPNVVQEQDNRFRVPARPVQADKTTKLRLGPFGIAVNGVLFDPGAAEFWDDDPRSGWQFEALSGKIDLGMDANNAHVQPTGSYHYHGLPKGLITRLGGAESMPLLGYAADGFPIYANRAFSDANDAKSKMTQMRSSYRVKKGTRPSGPRGTFDGTYVEDYEYVAGLGDLDECNGRRGVTPQYPEGTYYYCLTSEFPFIPRAWRGHPDESFRRGPDGPPPGPDGKRRPPPPKRRRPGDF
jgi:hypothetical protein